jgi:predicted amidohydrolase YtcJ
MKIETLFVNGRILTMDPARPEVEAVAVSGGRIVTTGVSAELLARRDRDTDVIDLGGRFGCAAFIDPHNHFSMTALAPVEADCRTPPLATIPQIMERIRDLAATLSPGAWLRGHGYDEEVLRERRHPTRAELDEAAPDHPVVLVHWSVHRCVLNSVALAALGIGRETPDPHGGWIVRGPDGLPAGPLYETATNPAQSRSIAAYTERFAQRAPDLLRANARRYAAAGITAVGDAYVSPALMSLYRSAAASGRLPLHVSVYLGSAEGLFAPPDAVLSARIQSPVTGTGRAREPHPALTVAGIKIFTDGGGNTTATSLDGEHAHRSAGRLFYRQDELDELIAAAHGQGLQVAVHAAGDMAVAMALTAMERARAAHPRIEPRLRVEHGVLLSDDLIRRLRLVGAALVAQPVSVYYHADRLATAPLAEGLRQLPLRDLLDAGVPVASSSDAPCYPMHPLLGVWAAFTRRTRSGGVSAADQRLSVEEALRMATTVAARAMGTEGEMGDLAPGKVANLVVLSADPRVVPPDNIREIRVLATYREGRLVYDRARDGESPVVGRLPDPR